MSISSNKKIRALLILILCAILVAGICQAALAAPSNTLDRNALGSITLYPTYDGKAISGGTFDIYKVATLNSSGQYLFDLYGTFINAAGEVDINKANTARELETAAKTLAKYINNVPAAEIIHLDRDIDGNTVNNLSTGAYLIIQTSIGSPYTVAAPFLVFIPSYDNEDGWQYNITAKPKLDRTDEEFTRVSVTKIWNDAGLEATRPSSVKVSLFRNGTQYGGVVTLSKDNNWKYSWRNLDARYTWTVREVEQDGNYIITIDRSGTSFTITNTPKAPPPLASTINVTKLWSGDDSSTRPKSVDVTLYRDGSAYATVTLNAANNWSYAWAGLGDGYTWTVRETSVPAGYTAAVTQSGYTFTVTNTYHGDKTPQTGLIQWPIPVLCLVALCCFIAAAAVNNRRKRHGG